MVLVCCVCLWIRYSAIEARLSLSFSLCVSVDLAYIMVNGFVILWQIIKNKMMLCNFTRTHTHHHTSPSILSLEIFFNKKKESELCLVQIERRAKEKGLFSFFYNERMRKHQKSNKMKKWYYESRYFIWWYKSRQERRERCSAYWSISFTRIHAM